MCYLSRPFRVVLAAAILMVGAPAWKHSHPGGNQPHHHKHVHDHDGAGKPHAHFHVTLFGIEVTLPAESDDDDDTAQGRPTYLVAAPPAIELGTTPSRFAVPAAPIVKAVQTVHFATPFRAKAVRAAHLCDTARHERSGVQLV